VMYRLITPSSHFAPFSQPKDLKVSYSNIGL
jgi:hypothetical protein